VLSAFERHHEVLAPTLPGHASGPPIVSEAAMRWRADAVGRVMEDARWQAAHIAGNALDGWVGRRARRDQMGEARGQAPAVEHAEVGPGVLIPPKQTQRTFRGSGARLADRHEAEPGHPGHSDRRQSYAATAFRSEQAAPSKPCSLLPGTSGGAPVGRAHTSALPWRSSHLSRPVRRG
jgi:hypothetical protein